MDCKPEYLAQFGAMGSVYLEHVFGTAQPRVGLLSIGEEASKGNQLSLQAHALLQELPVNFVGNIEGKDIFAGLADVVVCDGFIGNVTLKVVEGLAATITQMLREEANRQSMAEIARAGATRRVPKPETQDGLRRVRWGTAARCQWGLHRRSWAIESIRHSACASRRRGRC